MENAGADSRGGKCRSDNGWKAVRKEKYKIPTTWAEVPRRMTWTFLYKLKLVTPILTERNILKKKWICYLATIANYYIVCWDAVRSVVLATDWLLVKHNSVFFIDMLLNYSVLSTLAMPCTPAFSSFSQFAHEMWSCIFQSYSYRPCDLQCSRISKFESIRPCDYAPTFFAVLGLIHV